MKINVSTPLKTLDGNPLHMERVGPVTLGFVCVDALLTPQQDDAQTQGLAARCYQIARRISVGDEVELAAEEIALIKARVERCHAPLVVGQVWDLLEGRDA